MAEPVSHEEARLIFEHMARTGFVGHRDLAWVVLLYRTGIRNNECRMLDMADLTLSPPDGQSPSLRVRHPKNLSRGSTRRSVGIDGVAMPALRAYLSLRGERPGPVFLTGNGNRVDTSQMRRSLGNAARAVGIGRPVSPHSFRHALAKELNSEGVSMRLIQVVLGHKNLNTTAVYLASLGDPEAVAATARRS